MRKWMCAMLVAALLAGFACAEVIGTRMEVVNCNEWITLREEPSKKADSLEHMPLGDASLILLSDDYDDFAKIAYDRKIGYALKEYLAVAEEIKGEPIELDEDERYNVNLFLSNFSEQAFAVEDGYYNRESATHNEVMDFTVRHICFNNSDYTEKGSWSRYDTRIVATRLAATAERYLNMPVKKASSRNIELKGNHFYWDSHDIPANSGFAALDSVEKLDEKRLSVHFRIYGKGQKWNNKVCRLSVEEVAQQYECGYIAHAIINMDDGDLDDRRDWYLERYTVTEIED